MAAAMKRGMGMVTRVAGTKWAMVTAARAMATAARLTGKRQHPG
jgi:hypothetical protein